MAATPFKISVPDSVLEDLQERLARTRWPDEVENSGWSMGTNLDYARELAGYWQREYDWRKQEAELNKLAQYKVDIDGVGVHFVHERGKGPNPTPIILTHGWPDSFHRFHKVIPMLTDPASYGGNAEDSFDVVVPSVPGFGFSDRKAMPSSAVADLWAKLMTEVLGYERFAAAGGDVGTNVTKALARQHPELLTGIHLTDVGYPTGQEDFSTMTEAEREYVGFTQGWWFTQGAYNMMQSTKPQTIAFSLNDSPVGLASWILSFVDTGADNHQVEAAFGGRDDLLTNITIYWATQTAGSAARMYREEARATYAHEGGPQPVGRSEVPASVALFPREGQFPREWAERTLNVQRFTKMPRGGHFAALEEPEMYANDLRESFHRG
jgi:microsomal epoxide hydrolase